MRKPKRIRVMAKSDRFGFDGQTGTLVFAGTPGTVAALTLEKTGQTERDGFPKLKPTLTVWWDFALLQDKANNDPSTTEDWEESDVNPADVTLLGTIDGEEEVTRG